MNHRILYSGISKDVLAFDLLPLLLGIHELRGHFLVFHVSLGSAPIKMLTLTSVLLLHLLSDSQLMWGFQLTEGEISAKKHCYHH